jgi:hypothetical protein
VSQESFDERLVLTRLGILFVSGAVASKEAFNMISLP